jgi:hypothetical protein
MKLYQVNKTEIETLKASKIVILVVESQNYGMDDEFLYHIVVSLQDMEAFNELGIGRPIEDKGRTSGFWQNLGGSGIYSTKTVIMQGFSANLTKLLANQPEAKVNFSGESWEEILRSMPLGDAVKELFLEQKEEQVEKSSTPVNSGKSRKKRHSSK